MGLAVGRDVDPIRPRRQTGQVVAAAGRALHAARQAGGQVGGGHGGATGGGRIGGDLAADGCGGGLRDRKRAGEGKSGAVREETGGGGTIKKTKIIRR